MSPARRQSAKQNRLLSALSSTEYARLAPLFEIVTLDRRETISSTGQPITHAVFPDGAVMSTVMELSEGEMVEVGLMGAEGFAGHNLLYRALVGFPTVVVHVPGSARRMQAEDFRRAVVEHGGETLQLCLRYAYAFMGMVSQVASCNASHGAEQRFARWLLMLHDRIDNDVFPVTQEFAALLLSLRRATVTQVAANLRAIGAIEYNNGVMRIRDRQILEGAACGCYAAIVDMTEAVFETA
jgi:CRP-like cAMP-binding protein